MSDSFLSQEEVDALLEGVTGESQKLEQDVAPTDGVRSYNLSSQERIVRGRMPTMEIVNERFSRNLRLGLFNFIRRSPEISVGAVQVQKYSAFLRELVVPTNFNIMAVRPLRGNGLVVCEPTLLFGVIDSLFGGSGKFHTRIEGRDFSPTEQRVIDRLVEVVAEEYKKAWRGVYPLELAYQRWPRPMPRWSSCWRCRWATSSNSTASPRSGPMWTGCRSSNASTAHTKASTPCVSSAICADPI